MEYSLENEKKPRTFGAKMRILCNRLLLEKRRHLGHFSL